MAQIIDGKVISTQIKDELKEKVALKGAWHCALPRSDSGGTRPGFFGLCE